MYAAETVDAGQADTEGRLEELGDDAGTAEKHNPGVGAEERGGHAAENADDKENLGPLQAIEGIEVSKGNPDEQGHEGHEEGDLKAVDDRLGVVALTEELLELGPGETAVGHNDRLLDDAEHRVNENRDEQQKHNDGYNEPSVKAFLYHGASPAQLSGRSL